MKIFVQIASYRDPQLVSTLKDMIANAKRPKNLRFGIARQFNPEDKFDDLTEYKNDKRFRILDIPFEESKGVCWARNLTQQVYEGEEYTMQIDSHMRFAPNWDDEMIKMVKQLQKKGHKKPLLTGYVSSFDPENDPAGRVQEPWRMVFDRFIPEGAVFFLPETIPGWRDMKEPVTARFYSAHYAFTLGQFSTEVQHNPEYYFHGEEISLAVRSYTWGYDLFHPHKVIAWHEYTRKGRTKQWDDDKEWVNKNNHCHKRNRALFAVDGECRCEFNFGPYDFGTERTLFQYEAYAGIRFRDRSIQQYTRDNNIAPNPVIVSPLDYEISFLSIFKHCIDIDYKKVPLDDYDFWCVAFENEQGETIYRQDAQSDEIKKIKNDPDGYGKIWREFPTHQKPVKWVVWPYSVSQGWCEKIEGNL